MCLLQCFDFQCPYLFTIEALTFIAPCSSDRPIYCVRTLCVSNCKLSPPIPYQCNVEKYQYLQQLAKMSHSQHSLMGERGKWKRWSFFNTEQVQVGSLSCRSRQLFSHYFLILWLLDVPRTLLPKYWRSDVLDTVQTHKAMSLHTKQVRHVVILMMETVAGTFWDALYTYRLRRSWQSTSTIQRNMDVQ